ncbi:hypothetical protein EGH21_05515 [Halomicroarcula sp. F13]|uniref:DUF3806 domain-containing protein n=1 Tax=Haloarcula rubra TaxID=2487747 RepID=A0AAW4PQJ9_9EURY|nr:hypothetical protein [Halomicroarcula rubra]MBX0322484.1 hypothetical protein [Halomicroarcula rubra]
MGLFDSIRRAVGGGDDGSDETEARPNMVDVTALGPDAFRDRAENAASDGDPLDFSVASLERLDEAIAAKDDWTERRPSDGTAYSPKTVQFGSYLGEVLVRTYDGEWTADDGWGVTVAGRDDDVTVDVFEVAARSVAGDPVFAAVAERLEAELELGDESGSDEADSTTVDDETVADEVFPTMDAVETDDETPPSAEDGAEQPPVADAADGHADDPATTTETVPSDAETERDTATTPDLPADSDPETDAARATDAAEAEQSDVDLLGSGAPDSDTDDDVETDTPTAPDPTVGVGEPPSTTGDTGPATETDPTAGDGLRAEYAATATEFTDFWTEHVLDFTPASLARLDDLVGAEWDDDRFSDATFGSEATFDDRAFTSVTTELGSYFGEVLVRALDGEWSADTDHEAVVVVEGTDGPLAVPVFQVAANSLRTVPVFARSYEALLSDLGRDG